jgi:predicted ATPase/DNA-binding NarL/FixJ family response regulator
MGVRCSSLVQTIIRVTFFWTWCTCFRTEVANVMEAAATVAGQCLVPVPANPLIGRGHERATLRELLRRPEARVLTITGHGGVGKTHLALTVAHELSDAFPDGLRFVDLTPVRDPVLVIPTIARTLEVGDVAGQALVQSLGATLRDRRMLIVLDNFEQVVAAAPELAALLALCVQPKLLLTSRVVIGLPGEHELALQPLPLPDVRHTTQPREVIKSAAVELFVQRAKQHLPVFDLTRTNSAAVAELSARLDGLPLAIELAAARIKVLSPEAMLARMTSPAASSPGATRRLDLLAGGPRSAPLRHQALRNTLDWSYGLLSASEQALLRSLSVFAGWWDLQAAVAITGAEGELDVLDGLTALVNNSLVQQRTAEDGEREFALLETVREYTRERLEAAGEDDTTDQRHVQHYLSIAETDARDAEHLTAVVERHQDNLRAALEWSLRRTDPESGLRLARRMFSFWYTRDRLTEGRHWMELALSRSGTATDELRAELMMRAGELAVIHGEVQHGEALILESLELWRRVGDKDGECGSLNNLGHAAAARGELPRAAEFYAQSLAVSKSIGPPDSMVQLNLAEIHAHLGNFDIAVPLMEANLDAERPMVRAQAHLQLGLAEILRRRLEPAQSHLRVSLLAGRDLQVPRVIAESLERLACVAAARSQPTEAIRAARLFGAAEALREAIATPRFAGDQQVVERYESSLRSRGNGKPPANAWQEGRTAPVDRVIAYALDQTPWQGRAESDPLKPLSAREREIAELIGRGLSNKQVAEQLVLSEGTVRIQSSTIYRKLGVESRTQLANLLREADTRAP